ncbi:putative lipid II flippase FtsW [Bdellovibrionota bacterium]
MTRREPLFDIWLLLTTLILVMIGLIMVFSTSTLLAHDRFGDSYYFIKRQIIFASLGLGMLVALMNFDYHNLKKHVYLILGASFLLLLLVFIPGLSSQSGLARRWLDFGVIGFQPGEAAKLALVVWLSYSLAKKGEKTKLFRIGVIPHFLVAFIFIVLLLLQPDFGTAAMLGILTLALLFVGEVRWYYLFGAVSAAIPALCFVISRVPYARQRIFAFLNPWGDPGDAGFQIIQSFLAFHSGKLTGLGLGDGRQKLFYLPEAHNDFIFSVIGEELGLFGVTIIVLLFFFFIYRGFRIAARATDRFGYYLASGITLIISTQALLNIGIVLGLLPTKGLPLPFISYGGSSLVVLLASTGILLNISTQMER